MTDTLAPPAARAVPSPAHTRRWWVLGVTSLAQLLIALDATIVNVALPDAQRSLGFSDASRQWVITAYALAFGSLLLIGGRVADLIGRRRALLIGTVIFGIGSALGGAASSFAYLAVARGLQGVGGALLAPAALGIVTTIFTNPAERARAFTVFGTIGGAGAAAGLLAGGVLTQNFGWRWTLYVNLVLSVVAILAMLAVVPRDLERVRTRLDALGTVLGTAGLFGIVFGLSRAEVDGWGSPSTWVTLLASAVVLAAFVRRQTRVAAPLLPLRIFADRNRAASLTSLLLINTGIFAAFLFLTYYLQTTRQYSPTETGAAFLPLIVGLFIGSTLALNVLPRFAGPRRSVAAGMALGAGSLLWLTTLDTGTSYLGVILPALVLLGIGAGIVFPTATNLGIAGVGAEDSGAAGALVNTTQQIGGSVGIALLSTIGAEAITRYLATRPDPTPEILGDAALYGYSLVFTSAAAIFALGALIAAAVYRNGVPTELRSGQVPVHA